MLISPKWLPQGIQQAKRATVSWLGSNTHIPLLMSQRVTARSSPIMLVLRQFCELVAETWTRDLKPACRSVTASTRDAAQDTGSVASKKHQATRLFLRLGWCSSGVVPESLMTWLVPCLPRPQVMPAKCAHFPGLCAVFPQHASNHAGFGRWQ